MLLTNTQVSKLRKEFANNSSANVKLSKTQLHDIGQSEGFLGKYENMRKNLSKYENIFAKGYISNWSEDVFVIKKVKNTVPWTYVISDLKVQEIIGTIYEKELQKTNHKEF